jgi:hypothetical protein
VFQESANSFFCQIIGSELSTTKRGNIMKKLFAIAALLAAFSPLSHAQDHSEPWRPGPNMRNDRPVVVVDEHRNRHVVRHVKAKPHVRCRDGSRQYSARACRHHRGVR